MNSLPRWLISITDMPDPCQSSISSAAWRSTGSGSAAGPALKLNTRVIGEFFVAKGATRIQNSVQVESGAENLRDVFARFLELHQRGLVRGQRVAVEQRGENRLVPRRRELVRGGVLA